MDWEAEVYAGEIGEEKRSHIGRKILSGEPVPNGHVWFVDSENRTVGGRVEHIEPADWQGRPGEALPKMIISLDRLL